MSETLELSIVKEDLIHYTNKVQKYLEAEHFDFTKFAKNVKEYARLRTLKQQLETNLPGDIFEKKHLRGYVHIKQVAFTLSREDIFEATDVEFFICVTYMNDYCKMSRQVILGMEEGDYVARDCSKFVFPIYKTGEDLTFQLFWASRKNIYKKDIKFEEIDDCICKALCNPWTRRFVPVTLEKRGVPLAKFNMHEVHIRIEQIK